MHPSPQNPDPVLLDLRPDRATYLRGLGTRALLVVPLIAALVLSSSRFGGLPFVVYGATIGAAVVIVVTSVLLATSRIRLTWHSVIIGRAVGTPRTIPREQIGYGVLVQRYRQFGNAEAPMLVLVDADRRRLVQLSGQYFDAAALTALAQQIGLRFFDVMAEPTTPADFDARHPGVLRFVERRPTVIVVVVLLAILAAVIGYVLLAGPH